MFDNLRKLEKQGMYHRRSSARAILRAFVCTFNVNIKPLGMQANIFRACPKPR